MPRSHRNLTRCDGVTRRDILRVGGLTPLGFGLGHWLELRRAAAQKQQPVRARACVMIWLDGGPSHLETFDLKPRAAAEVRGPLQPIQTSVAGIQIGECLPHTAKMADRVAIIRSITSPLGEHNFGTHYVMTGHKPTPVLEYPAVGSVHAATRPKADVLPPHIAIPDFRVGGGRFSGGGFLTPSAHPFAVGSDPSRPDFRVRDLDFFRGLDISRLGRRRRFMRQLDAFSRRADAGDVPVNPSFEQAYRLISSGQATQAFDLSEEPAATRKRYGSRQVGQCCLLARRLIERGVPFVTVNQRGWDTHNALYTRLKEGYTGAKHPVGLIPTLDLALTALIEDLEDRRLLDETLIVVMGEFGRTPKLNTLGGRDHWPRVFSALLAGAGIAGGQVIGASDAVGESPLDRPVTPADVAHTLYRLLGIDPAHEL
ncbi:MAG: DUF1501 domain-containing protein, partial [Planctomycetaceae bacterium]